MRTESADLARNHVPYSFLRLLSKECLSKVIWLLGQASSKKNGSQVAGGGVVLAHETKNNNMSGHILTHLIMRHSSLNGDELIIDILLGRDTDDETTIDYR